jgi:alkylmercury lyase
MTDTPSAATASGGRDYRELPLPAELSERLGVVLALDHPPASFGDLAAALRPVLTVEGGVAPERLCCAGQSRHEVRFEGSDEVTHTHCVLDALILPLLADTTAHIRSTDPLGGVVSIAAGPGEVSSDATDAVISFGAANGDGHDVYEAVCPYINAFATRSDYERWAARTPEAITVALSLPDAAALAADLAAPGR